MIQPRSATITALLLSVLSVSPAQALDFHPLTSQELPGGVYEFDNIFIPQDVTLTLVGEPRQATLRALGDLTLAGSLVAPGWEVRLEAGHSLQMPGSIDVGGGTVPVYGEAEPGRVVLPGREIDDPRVAPRPANRFQGTLISLASGGELALLNTRVSEAAGLVLTAGGDLAVQGIIPASTLLAGRVTTLGWREFDLEAGASVSFEASPDVANLVLSGRALQTGEVRFSSEEVVLHNGGGIEIAGIVILEPATFLNAPERLVIETALPVPEPDTRALLLAGLGLVAAVSRRRSTRPALA